MNWNVQFPQTLKPELSEINAHIDNSLWMQLLEYLSTTYEVNPSTEYSRCSGAPGWNVKYKKGSKALCTLYPNKGYFTCLVSVGSKQAMGAELMLGTCTEYLSNLYWNARPFNGGRWLMIDVTSQEILNDVKRLIALRVKPKK
ncbi:MAG: hypothetical protein K0S60_674 [Evtepia sp.]|jgi:hypothetical protein|nr:hypothetical protein [Evtepia sp.]